MEETTDLLEFAYSYPAEAAAIPAIAERFQAELRKGRADMTEAARQDRKDRQKEGFPFMAYSLQTGWTVHANTPRLLSLLSDTYSFTGGAHGMTGYAALLWDRQAGRDVPFTALTVSPAAFAAVIRDRFCDALDAARTQKRGEPVVRSGEDDFTACVDPLRQVLVPVSRDGKVIDSITVVIGPYEAGPYSEGSYEIALPVDAAMRGAIAPGWRDAFSAGQR